MKFQINDNVKVARLSDETADRKLLSRCGKVISFDFDCGCGQSRPYDCMYLVDFGTVKEEFWSEELERVR